MGEAANTARLVKKVVIGYQLPAMPSFLMQGLLLLRNKLARAGFQVEVALCPLTQLPPDIDLLFAPAELVEAASQAAPQTQVIPLTAKTAQQPAYTELLKQLKVGQEFYALSVEESEAEDYTIIRYRGYTRLS